MFKICEINHVKHECLKYEINHVKETKRLVKKNQTSRDKKYYVRDEEYTTEDQ
jgi:hypothetical protein